MLSKTTFPYSNVTLRLPKGKERTLAMARERAKKYAENKRSSVYKGSDDLAKDNRVSPALLNKDNHVSPTLSHIEVNGGNVENSKNNIENVKNNVSILRISIPTNKEGKRNNTTMKKNHKQYSHVCEPDVNTIREFPGKNPDIFLNLLPYVNAVLKQKREKGGKEGGKDIYGDATEYWFMDNFNCQRCNMRNWIKCKERTPAFDCECNNCKTVYSIKSSNTSDFLKKSQDLKIDACGRYTPLINAHEKRLLDWILIYYDKDTNTIKRLYYIPHDKINSLECITSRKPLGIHTKNPGWKGSKITFSKDIFKQLV